MTGAAVDIDADMEPCKVVRSKCAKAVSGKNAPEGKISEKDSYILKKCSKV
jgi:hypothetical protein